VSSKNQCSSSMVSSDVEMTIVFDLHVFSAVGMNELFHGVFWFTRKGLNFHSLCFNSTERILQELTQFACKTRTKKKNFTRRSNIWPQDWKTRAAISTISSVMRACTTQKDRTERNTQRLASSEVQINKQLSSVNSKISPTTTLH
jgi:hypothetical protein